MPSRQADRWFAGLYFLAPLLRISIGLLWLFTGLISAFVYPAELSYGLLAEIGIEAAWQPAFLYGAALMDTLLGIATLFSVRLHLIGRIQIVIILVYSAIITVWLPAQWLHPFGALTKNLPLLVSTMILLILEERK
ncbi:DoxX-like family protein [Motiliproteus sp.]|uniref:DoxX-like family protein n=1 Tax=Motiliproteus sp. TaxID=1898955 RepID=UPI003BAAA0EC